MLRLGSYVRLYQFFSPGPVFTKAFQNKDQDQAQVKILILWTFFSKTYYNYLTIDCWCLIKDVLQTRLLVILSFFMKEEVNFIVATVMTI